MCCSLKVYLPLPKGYKNKTRRLPTVRSDPIIIILISGAASERGPSWREEFLCYYYFILSSLALLCIPLGRKLVLNGMCSCTLHIRFAPLSISPGRKSTLVSSSINSYLPCRSHRRTVSCPALRLFCLICVGKMHLALHSRSRFEKNITTSTLFLFCSYGPPRAIAGHWTGQFWAGRTKMTMVMAVFTRRFLPYWNKNWLLNGMEFLDYAAEIFNRLNE